MDKAHLTQFKSNGFDIAESYIKKKSASSVIDIGCSMIPGCQEKARKIILQLLMINWGIFGIGSSSAGMFLANHFSTIGPYFGNNDGHNWPREPLSKDPLPLESMLNEMLTKITEKMSSGKLRNTSIIDLPAFGSKIPWLKKKHKRQPNWPTEMNFAIHNKNYKTISETFRNYKTLLKHWENYMEEVYRKDILIGFTPEMENNHIFNFTKYVEADLTTFLIAIHGSFLTGSNQTLPLLNQIGKEVLNSANILNDASDKGLYDKLIMQCGFQKDLSFQKEFNLDGGCDGFQPTLTSNGMCYTFNGERVADIWKPSNITNSFKKIFHQKQQPKEFFRDAGITGGKLKKKAKYEGII